MINHYFSMSSRRIKPTAPVKHPKFTQIINNRRFLDSFEEMSKGEVITLAKPELTKELMAKTLKELMKRKPLDKISVQEIVEACGLNRKTFYYHFRDKQALVSWIFDHDYASLTDLNQDNSTIDELVEHLYNNQEFYIAALTSNAQNNLREHLFKIVNDAITDNISFLLGTNVMSPKKTSMIAHYFSHAMVGSIMEWAKGGMKTSPDEQIIDFHQITQDCLEFMVNKYSKK
jgi:probable dihydroxyacetone kinase regulator